jgi:hypothetical protein
MKLYRKTLTKLKWYLRINFKGYLSLALYVIFFQGVSILILTACYQLILELLIQKMICEKNLNSNAKISIFRL